MKATRPINADTDNGPCIAHARRGDFRDAKVKVKAYYIK